MASMLKTAAAVWRAAALIFSRSRWSMINVRIASNSAASDSSTTIPLPEARTVSASPQLSVITTGSPTDIASSTDIGKGSSTEGNT